MNWVFVKKSGRAIGASVVGLGFVMLSGCGGPGATMVRNDPAKEIAPLGRVYVYSFTNASVPRSGVSEDKFLAAIERELAGRGVYAKGINAIKAGKKAGMVVYQNRSSFSDGRGSVMRMQIPVGELIALHGEDEKKDGITHRITIFPETADHSSSLIVGNYMKLSLAVYTVNGQALARGSLHYQYRFVQDAAELASLLAGELEKQGLVSRPSAAAEPAPQPVPAASAATSQAR